MTSKMLTGNRVYLVVLIASIFWGTIGTFGKLLMNYGLLPLEVAFCRLFFGCILLFLFAFFYRKEALRISKKGLLYTLVLGIFCQALFNILYFNSIQRVGIAIAAVLLYTAPIYLAFLSRFFFKERITSSKKISIILCVLGSFLAVTGGVLNIKSLDIIGILLGIGAALSYACLSVLSKHAMTEVNELSLIMYSFLIGWILLLPIVNPIDILHKVTDVHGLLLLVGQGLFTSALPYMFYMTAVRAGAELTRSGVICSVELIISVVIGWCFFAEGISLFKVVGVGIIVLSVLVAATASARVKDASSIGEIDCQRKVP